METRAATRDHRPLGNRSSRPRAHVRRSVQRGRTSPRREAPAGVCRPAPGHPRPSPARCHSGCAGLPVRGPACRAKAHRQSRHAAAAPDRGPRQPRCPREGRHIDGTEIRGRRPAAGPKDRDAFISGKSEQDAVASVVVTDGDGRVCWCSPTKPGSCADIIHARQSGLVKLLADGCMALILADAGYQGLGAKTGGHVVTPPHLAFKKNPPDQYEEMYERQREAYSSRRIRVEHGLAHLKLAGTDPPPQPPRTNVVAVSLSGRYRCRRAARGG
ncbi:transposase family protein [Streptomyces sp. NPDC057494]|uniref:transposase family protein n=1 Tax=Streptomyces sp. NPDC057494 TaxID=3346148 RepID=UPI0036903528